MTPVEGLQGCWGAWGGRVHHRWIYPPQGPVWGALERNGGGEGLGPFRKKRAHKAGAGTVGQSEARPRGTARGPAARGGIFRGSHRQPCPAPTHVRLDAMSTVALLETLVTIR